MNGLNLAAVFIEGLLSFLSPCVLPLVPLYMAYLSIDKGNAKYPYLYRIFMSLCFVMGIMTSYFLLALASDIINDFIASNKIFFDLFGGSLIILCALYLLGFIDIPLLRKERRLELDPLKRDGFRILRAYLLGFVFSFAWTPCIGPMMASVLIIAGSEPALGSLYIIVYGLGFGVPFIVVALVYDKAIAFIKNKQKMLVKISKAAAIIILVFGFALLYEAVTMINDLQHVDTVQNEEGQISFSLRDNEGVIHKLSDYEGDYVVLNFIASWCTYCKQELPAYEELAASRDDVHFFYVMNEDINASRAGGSIDDFIGENMLKQPVLIDSDQALFSSLGISAFPTLVFIGPDGSYIGYQNGAMDQEMMNDILEMAIDRYNKEG